MGYCDLDDILDMMDEAEVIRYTDDEDAGVVNTAVTDKAMAAADALIDSHLATRYGVPVSPVPGIVRDLAVDIAIYKICSRRGQSPEEIRTKYEDAVKYLEKVAAGKIRIPGANPADGNAGSDAVSIANSPRIFSRDSMKEW
jgi:phage gp36-like protein